MPKRLGLQRAEAFSLALGPMIDKVSKVSRPVIWVLSKSTNFVVRLLGGDPDAQKEQMSDEELREPSTPTRPSARRSGGSSRTSSRRGTGRSAR